MAIDELLDEHEQSERVRSWLRQNALGLFGGIALGLLAIMGWNWWKQQRQTQAENEAGRYHTATQAAKAGPAEAAKALTGFTRPPYATLSALQLAKAQADAGQSAAAIATLRKARDAATPELQAVIVRRLARLLIQDGKAAEAAGLMQGRDDIASLAILGDAQLAQGQRDAARASYAKALGKAEVGSPLRVMLELKIAEVGGLPDTTGHNNA